jgi:hypothetical protein
MDKKEDILYRKIMNKVHQTDQRQPSIGYLKLFLMLFNVPMKVAACTVFIIGVILGYIYYSNNMTNIDRLYNSASYMEVLDGNE